MFGLLDGIEEDEVTPREKNKNAISNLEEEELETSCIKEDGNKDVITDNRISTKENAENAGDKVVGSTSGRDFVSLVGISKIKLSKEIKTLGHISSSMRISRNEGGSGRKMGGPSPSVLK
ncbi:hypothetical protein MA16_Dca016253 [Dendrobium catenatum]|uniref:Uncharacterized protein n=1 Tax=Dendrobium catenatum TaxID=906689 RepID=A0A2I0W5M5_9ASPA|nr:hypothetical protein MA16_Dca016253 [Dendrobium catenatum]